MGRHGTVPLAGLVALVTLLVAGCGAGPEGPPNVLVVTIDTLRADRTGPYGFALGRTPTMDRLAAEGVVCENAVTAAPITLPAHATLFTGLLPPAHGVRDNGAFAVGEEAVTLAERLQAAGWETRAFVSAAVLNRRYGLAQGFDSYDDALWTEERPPLFMVPDRPAWRTAERFEEWYGERLERRRAAASGQAVSGEAVSGEVGRLEEKPFFAWVHFFDPHQPYEAPAAYNALAPTPYDAEIAAADHAMGRLLAALEQGGELDDTLVLFTADHGESLGEHGEKTHAVFIYDATMKVPMIWRYPRAVERGERLEAPVHLVDVVPTVLSILGLEGGDETQGLDLAPALAGGRVSKELVGRAQYLESLLSEVGFGMAPLYGVRQDGYKWIRAPRPEVYDLETDPDELVNLYDEERRRARLLDRELQGLLDDSERHAVGAEEQPMERETLEMLQALGYLAPAADREAMGAVQGMDPKDGIVLYGKLEDARHLAQQEEWAEARELLREIVAVLPENLSAWNVLGMTSVRLGELDVARDAYLRSLAIEPRQSRVHVMLGLLDLEEGNLEEARAAFERALEITPEFVEGMAHLGLVAAVAGDDEGAARWYERAIETDPGFPRVWRRQGDLFFERGDWERALESYRRGLENQPDDLHALLQAGASARRAGSPEQAAEYLETAAALRPDAWLPAYNLACLAASTGETAEALELLGQAIERGLRRPRLAIEDPDLEALRDSEEFRELMTDMVRRARAEQE